MKALIFHLSLRLSEVQLLRRFPPSIIFNVSIPLTVMLESEVKEAGRHFEMQLMMGAYRRCVMLCHLTAGMLQG